MITPYLDNRSLFTEDGEHLRKPEDPVFKHEPPPAEGCAKLALSAAVIIVSLAIFVFITINVIKQSAP